MSLEGETCRPRSPSVTSSAPRACASLLVRKPPWASSFPASSTMLRYQRTPEEVGVLFAVLLMLGGCEDGTSFPGDEYVGPTPSEEQTGDRTLEPARVLVPDVVGLRLPRARQELRDAGLTLAGAIHRPSSEQANTVLSQDPAAGAKVRPGRVVFLEIAEPEPPPPPPDYLPHIPPGPDVDCAGGSGDGPRYQGQGDVPFGPFQVVGSDIYGLDGDNDGVGCE